MSVRKEWIAPITRLNAQYLLDVFGGAHWTLEAQQAADEAVRPREHATEPFPSWYTPRTTPFGHQITALNRSWAARAFGFFMEMGTGKTKTVIDLLCAKAMDGQINAALIFAPMSVVLTWRDEISAHSTLDSTIVRLRVKTRHDAWPCVNGVELSDGFTWYLANIEGLSAGKLFDVAMQAVAGKSFAMVVDESSRIKNHEAIRTKRCLALGALAQQRYALSGLPVLKGVLDLYSQLQFLDPDITGVGDFYCFRNRYAVMGGFDNREILGYQNLEELAAAVAPHVYQVTKKEALTLPDKMYRVIRVELTKDQLQQIRAVRAGLIGTAEKSRSLKNILERILRIQQIASGAVLHLDDELNVKAIPSDDNPKMQALRDILSDFEGQVIIWCSFLFEVAAVQAVLTALGISHVVHTGDTEENLRKQYINDFQAGRVRAFVATSSSGGIGITLTAASMAIYVSNSWSLETRAQSEDRAHRIGQTNKVEYIDLVAEGSADELVRTALKDKKDLAAYVRELIQQGLPIAGVDK